MYQIFWISFGWIFLCCLLQLPSSNGNEAYGMNSWYIGCYMTVSGDGNDDGQMTYVSSMTPSACSKRCKYVGKEYAGLSGTTDCFCFDDIQMMILASEVDCSIRCAANQKFLCGGSLRYSVFSIRGPYIYDIRVETSPMKAITDHIFNIAIFVRLGSAANISIGLPGYEATNFDFLNVIIDTGDHSSRAYSVKLEGDEAVLRIQHIYRAKSFPIINATVSNAVSIGAMRYSVQVISSAPRGLTMSVTSFGNILSTCDPSADSFAKSDASSRIVVMKGTPVEILADIEDGANLTFVWNVCGTEVRRSVPYLYAACRAYICTSDQQTFKFNSSGTCNVTVTVSNKLDSTFAFIVVTVRSPIIENVTVSTISCPDETPCPVIIPAEVLGEHYDHYDNYEAALNGPGASYSSMYSDSNVQEQTSLDITTLPITSPTPTQASFREKHYRIGETVCFHATAYMTAMASTTIDVNFGDGGSFSDILYDPYFHFAQRLSEMRSNFTFCYKDGCSLSIYFNHTYEKPGYYNIDVQISNSTYETSAHLNQPVRIIGNSLTNSVLMCDNLVKVGDVTTMIVRGGSGMVFTWIIDRRDEKDKAEWKDVSSARWKRLYRIPRSSPLRHTFTKHGMYFIRISDTHKHIADQESCLIIVEESIDGVAMVVHPELRYAVVGEPLRATLNVGRGSNFTVTWYVGSEVNSSSVRHDAPYSSTISIVPSLTKCLEVRAVVQNTVSISDTKLNKLICSQEMLTGLKMDVPERLAVGQSAMIIVTLSRASQVEVTVDITCSTGTHFMSLRNTTGAKTGPITLEFSTLPFRSPGVFDIVARARNHISAGTRRLSVAKQIQVGKFIDRVTAVRIDDLTSTEVYENEENNLIVLVNDLTDNSSGILYEWDFWNEQGKQLVQFSASPVAKIRPYCLRWTIDRLDCTLNLTATSGFNKTAYTMNVTTGKTVGRPQRMLRHPVIVEFGSECEINATCQSNDFEITGCRVRIIPGNAVVGTLAKNSTTSFRYLFAVPGLWEIVHEFVDATNVAVSETSFVSIQEKVTKLQIKGDAVLTVDEAPGSWQVFVGSGSHFVFQWMVRKKNSSKNLVYTTKATCERKLDYVFKHPGYYEVIVNGFNDVSRMTTSMDVKVRRTSSNIAVQTSPVYLGELSKFFVSVNLSRPFTLTVIWQEEGHKSQFSQDQLQVAGGYSSAVGIATYHLSHLYETSGEHCYNMTLEWLVADEIVQREFIGYAMVYNTTVNPPLVATVKRRNQRQPLHFPYEVAVGDMLLVEVNVSRVVTSLCWIVQKDSNVVQNISVLVQKNNTNHPVYQFNFSASTSGSYLCKVGSNLVSTATLLHIFAYQPITNLSLNPPYKIVEGWRGRIKKYITNCQLKAPSNELTAQDKQHACTPVTFSAKSNGENVTFIFRLSQISDADENESIEVVVNQPSANSDVEIDSIQMRNTASMQHVFTREGAYNISVRAFTVHNHVELQDVASLRTSLNYLFYAQALPEVHLARKEYVLLPGQSAQFELIQTKPDQKLAVDWVMGDGTTYLNSGLTISDYRYEITGRYEVVVTAKNKIGRTRLRASVTVQRKIERVELSTRTNVYLTYTPVQFLVLMDPQHEKDMLEYKWHFGNNTKAVVKYRLPVTHDFYTPGSISVWVVVKNLINEVKSNIVTLTLVDRMIFVRIECAEVVEVGKPFKMEAIHNTNFAVQHHWIFDDGTVIFGNATVNHTFNRTGLHAITLVARNELNDATATRSVFVMKKSCPVPSVHISGFDSQRENTTGGNYIVRKGFPEGEERQIFESTLDYYVLKSDLLRFEANVKFNCSQVDRVDYFWTVKRRRPPLDYNHNVTVLTGYTQELRVDPNVLPYGTYGINVNVSLIGTVLFATLRKVQVFVVEPSRLVARINGASKRTATRQEDVIINASTSYDPDSPSSELKFSWKCYVKDSPSTSCFHKYYVNRTDTEQSAPIIRRMHRSPGPQSAVDSAMHSWFPEQIRSNESILIIPTVYLETGFEKFIFKVDVAKTGRPGSSSYATFVLIMSDNEQVARIRLDCPSCYHSSINRQNDALLTAHCTNCYGGRVKFEWKLSAVDDGDDGFWNVKNNESANCMPSDGSGWILSWATNITSNQSLVLNNTRSSSSHSSPVSINEVTDIHRDNSNFTGRLPEYDTDVPIGNMQDFMDTYRDTPSQSPVDASAFTWEDLSQQQNVESLFNAFPSTSQTTNDSNFFESYDGLEFSTFLQTNLDLSENSQQTASERFPLFGSRSQPASPFETRTDNSGPFTNMHSLTFQNQDHDEVDHLRSDGASTVLPSDGHYEDYFHESRILDLVATSPKLIESKEGSRNDDVLILHRNSLHEGRTYAVTVHVTHYSDGGRELKRGSSSYYLRVNNGPSFGRCGLQPKSSNTYHAHCFGWKNKQNKRSDTEISVEAALKYELSYTLGDEKKSRPLYLGTQYDRSFQLPTSDKPVYLHVKIFNDAGAFTEVCSVFANTTKDQDNVTMTPWDKLDFVYKNSVGNSSMLHHVILQKDGNAILGHVNVMLDSLPQGSELLNMTTVNPKVDDTLQSIARSLIEGLAEIPSFRLIRSGDLLTTLSNILNLHHQVDSATLLTASGVVSRVLTRSQQIIDDKARAECCDTNQWNRLGKEITFSHIAKDIIEATLSVIGNMTLHRNVLLHKRRTTGRKIRSSASADDDPVTSKVMMSSLEKNLRDFFFATNKEQAMILGQKRFTSAGIDLAIQKAKSNLNIETSDGSVGAMFPKSSLSGHDNVSLLQTALFYRSTTPYKSKSSTPEVNHGAVSLWLMTNHHQEVMVENLVEPITIRLPPRPVENAKEQYSFSVTRDEMFQHNISLVAIRNRTLHINVRTDPKVNRRFPIFVALSHRPLNEEAPLNDFGIITKDTIRRRTASRNINLESVNFTLQPSELTKIDMLYITLLNEDAVCLDCRTPSSPIPYLIDAWFSDCFYWNAKNGTWDNKGCKTSSKSTLRQTVCTTTHLSTYASSFRKVEPLLVIRQVVVVTTSALSSCLTVMLSVFTIFCCFLLIHRYVLRRRETRSDYDELVSESRPNGIGMWLRWMFGADDRGASGRVPIILKDNKPDHQQVFEITVHTGNRPGSGTTSLPHIVLYGLEGKYEARQLEPPFDRENLYLTSRNPNGSCLFETGSIKTFIVTFKKNLGPLWKICAWHDHTGARPRWYLDYIIVRDVTSGERCFFPCHSWLALDRGPNRISRNLLPVEAKPVFSRQLAIRARNYLLDYHSLISVFACARWGVLSRAQRIVHIMTLCMVIFALATVKTIMFESRKYGRGISTFSWESVSWGIVTGIVASVILLPAQLILRYTKRDERISVTIEDNTSRTSNSHLTDFSRISLPNSHRDETRKQQGALHKTATVIHNFEELDEMMRAVPTTNDVVTDWLQYKELRERDRESECKDYRGDPGSSYFPGSIVSLDSLPGCPSVSTYDEEIARCMMTGNRSTSSTHLSHTRDAALADVESSRGKGLTHKTASYYEESVLSFDQNILDETMDVTNAENILSRRRERPHDTYENDEVNQPSILAMDGPELVPCEKLEPMPRMRSGYLPRQCRWVGWAYYALACVISAFCAIYGIAKYLADTNFDRWMEAWCFALFWTVVTIEVVVIFVVSVLASLRNVLGGQNLLITLEELFPTVDSAPVDDYAYKDYKYGFAEEASQCIETVSSSELKRRLSERRRSRYLRNISPPYNEKGKWKRAKNPLRKLAKSLRNTATARQALNTWLILFILGLLLIVAVATRGAGNRDRIEHENHVKSWFDEKFCVVDGFFVSTNCSNLYQVTPFMNISSFREWRLWFEMVFYGERQSPKADGNSTTPQFGNFLLLSTVYVSALRRYSREKCASVPPKIKQILNVTECPGLPSNHSSVDELDDIFPTASYFARRTFQLNLLQLNMHQHFSFIDNADDGMKIQLIAYNRVTRHYVTVAASSLYRRRNMPGSSVLQVRSVYLGHQDKITRDALTFIHVVLVFWVAWCAFKGLISIVESVSATKEQRQELSRRSLLVYGKFLSLLDFGLWLTVVLYLLAATVQRKNVIGSAKYIEDTGHVESDYAAYLDGVLDNELKTHYLLGVWTVLLVIKSIVLLVSWHGTKSSITRNISAMCSAMKSDCIPVFFTLIMFLLLMTGFGYLLFGTSHADHSSFVYSLQQTARWSIGFSLNTSRRGGLLKYKTLAGGFLFFVYFFSLFVTMRLVLKAFLVAVYQRKLRLVKDANKKLRHVPLQGCACKRTDSSLDKAGCYCKKHSARNERRKTIREKASSTEPRRHVSLLEMFLVAKERVLGFVRMSGSILFCGDVSRCVRLRTSDFDFSAYNRASNSTLRSSENFEPKSLFSSRPAKDKLGQEIGYLSSDTTSGFVDEFSITQPSINGDIASIECDDEYLITGDVAMSEIEIQVNELCLRANACIDDTMQSLDIFGLPLENKDHSESGKNFRSRSSGYDTESEINKLSEKLAAFVRRHDYHGDDDADTVITASTVPPDVESSWTLTEVSALEAASDHLSEKPADSSSASISDMTFQTNSRDSFRNLSQTVDCNEKSDREEDRKEGCSDPDTSAIYKFLRRAPESMHGNLRPSDSVQNAFEFRSHVSGEAIEMDNKDINGVSDEPDKQLQMPSTNVKDRLPGLTAFNLACHNRRLHSYHSMFAATSSGLEPQQPIPEKVESVSSATSEEKVTLQDFNQSEGNRATNLWKMLIRSKRKHRRTAVKPIKARPLRRSHTVFLDAKKLPAFEFAASPSDGTRSSESQSSSNSSPRPPRFAAAFDHKRPQPYQRPVRRQTSDITHESSTALHQPDFCEEERNLPGFIPEGVPSQERGLVITKQSARGSCKKSSGTFVNLR